MEYEYGVEIGVWKILQDRTTLDLKYYKYGAKVGAEREGTLLRHNELYDKLSAFAAQYSEEE